MTFAKAVKEEAKLRLAIAGPSGSGKTYTSLAIATALAAGKPIALVDTEHGSASKYADLFPFDVLELTAPFHPDRFIAAIQEASKAGYAVLILDSLSHAWNGAGGLLEIVDDIAKRMKTTNTFTAWKDATPLQTRMVEAILEAPLHIIATMRSKQEYILTADEKGKQVPRKVGMAPVQREGFEYEFDVFLDMDIDNTGIVSKTRCPALTGGVFKKPGANVADILAAWLHGAPVEHKQAEAVDPLILRRREKVNGFNAAPRPTNGTWGAVQGILSGLCNGDGGRKHFLSVLFEREIASSNDLTAPEAAWLQAFVRPHNVDGEGWQAADDAQQTIVAFMQRHPAPAPDFPAAEDLHPESAHLEPA